MGCDSASIHAVRNQALLQTACTDDDYYVGSPQRIGTALRRNSTIPSTSLYKFPGDETSGPLDPFRFYFPNGKATFTRSSLDHINMVYIGNDYVIATTSMGGAIDHVDGRYMGVRCSKDAQCVSGYCGATSVCNSWCSKKTDTLTCEAVNTRIDAADPSSTRCLWVATSACQTIG